MTLPHEEACDNAPASGHDVVDGEGSSRLSGRDWRWARQRAEEGFSARSIARLLHVDHSAILREAKRRGWRVRWGRKVVRAPQAPVYVDRAAPSGDHPTDPQELPAPPSVAISAHPTSETADRSRHDPETCRSPSTAAPCPEVVEPPDDPRAARLWRCRRCGVRGFDLNRRANAWHSQALCDETVARLNAGLDHRPKPFDVMRAEF